MAKSSLDMVREQEPVEVTWRAFELRPGGTMPDPAYARTIEERWPQTIKMGRKFGIEMVSHRLGVDTRPAHRAMKIVGEMSPALAEPFGMAVFRAYFVANEEIDDPEVLVRLGTSVGADGARLRARLAAGDALDLVLQEEREAKMSGIQGVPAFVFEQKYLISGVLPPEELVALLHRVRELESSE